MIRPDPTRVVDERVEQGPIDVFLWALVLCALAFSVGVGIGLWVQML